MELHDNEYIYEVAPPFQNNRLLPKDQMIWFGVKGISMLDSDKLEMASVSANNDFARDKAAEIIQGKLLDMIKGKIDSINNLVVGGRKITAFDEMYRLASCKEITNWLCTVIHSTISLSAAEIKNFLPESDTPS